MLSGTNTYSGGTTINGGTLTASNASALGTGSVAVNSSGTLNVNGVALANAVTLNSGTLTGTGGSLTGTGANALSGSGAIGSGSSLTVSAFNLTITDATTSNKLTLAGGASLTLTALNLSFATNMAPNQGNALWSSNQSWTVVSGGSTITGTALGTGSSGYSNGSFSLSAAGPDLALNWTATAIPEPSTYAAILGVVALVGAVWQRRRQRTAF